MKEFIMGTEPTNPAGDVTSPTDEPGSKDAVTGSTTTAPTTGADPGDLASLRDALERERQLRRDAERRAKEGSTFKTRLDELQAAQMTEQEKAVAKAVEEAKTSARTEALASTAIRLARAEFRAAASGRVEPSALDGFLEYADLAKFVTPEGEPDEKAIKAGVDKLAGPQRTSFDGGARQSAAATTDMNALIRQKAFGQ
jgi:hypothetical protein